MIECKHINVDFGYGYAYKSGWRGLGAYDYCTDCYTVLEFHDDYESNTPEEIEHNKNKREKNK